MPKQKIMKLHPLCKMFGQLAPMPKAEREQMLESIKQNGIRIPILVNKKRDTILDGATRWSIAYDLKLNLPQDRFEVFESDKDEDIQQEIMARNLHRRHLTDDQRIALVSKLLGPQLEAEAKERQSKAGTFKGKVKLDGAGSVAEEIVKKVGGGATKYKANQAEKARKAGGLDEVIAGKVKLRAAAKKAPTKKRVQKEIAFVDIVYKKWSQWLNRFPHPKRREVMDYVTEWCGGKGLAKKA